MRCTGKPNILGDFLAENLDEIADGRMFAGVFKDDEFSPRASNPISIHENQSRSRSLSMETVGPRDVLPLSVLLSCFLALSHALSLIPSSHQRSLDHQAKFQFVQLQLFNWSDRQIDNFKFQRFDKIKV